MSLYETRADLRCHFNEARKDLLSHSQMEKFRLAVLVFVIYDKPVNSMVFCLLIFSTYFAAYYWTDVRNLSSVKSVGGWFV